MEFSSLNHNKIISKLYISTFKIYKRWTIWSADTEFHNIYNKTCNERPLWWETNHLTWPWGYFTRTVALYFYAFVPMMKTPPVIYGCYHYHILSICHDKMHLSIYIGAHEYRKFCHFQNKAKSLKPNKLIYFIFLHTTRNVLWYEFTMQSDRLILFQYEKTFRDIPHHILYNHFFVGQ